MRKIIKEAVIGNVPFWILTLFTIILLTFAFFLPPTAIIDKSVLAAVGELMGFGALWTVVKAIDKGASAKLQHNNTSLTIGDEDKDK